MGVEVVRRYLATMPQRLCERNSIDNFHCWRSLVRFGSSTGHLVAKCVMCSQEVLLKPDEQLQLLANLG
jgi:hypothetical protein